MLPQALPSQTCTTFKALSWSVLLRCPTHPGGVSQESLTCPVQPWPKPLWWWSVLSRRASCTLASGNSATSQIKENLDFATNKQVFFFPFTCRLCFQGQPVWRCVCVSHVSQMAILSESSESWVSRSELCSETIGFYCGGLFKVLKSPAAYH